MCVRKREREVASGHGRKMELGGQRQSVVFGEVLKGRTLGSVIEDELFFFFLFGRWGQ